MKGIFEFDLGEKKIGFKFGTYAFAIACEKDRCVLSEFFKRLGLQYEGDDGEKKVDPVNVMSFLNLFYGAAVQYSKNKKLPIDFEVDDVSDWLDEIGIESVQNIFSEGLKTYSPKNSKSPT